MCPTLSLSLEDVQFKHDFALLDSPPPHRPQLTLSRVKVIYAKEAGTFRSSVVHMSYDQVRDISIRITFFHLCRPLNIIL